MRHLLTATVTVLLLNMALASAPPSARVEQPTRACALAAVSIDLDGDGSSDDATADVDVVRLRFFHGGQMILDARSTIVAVAANDLDRDGDRDLVALSRRGALFVWRNDGSGHFSYQPPKSPASGRGAEWSHGRIDTGSGSQGSGISAERRSLNARAGQEVSVHAPDRAGLIAFGTAGLHSSSTIRPGSPRSPPPC